MNMTNAALEVCAIAAIAGVLLTGCVVSVEPVIAESDAVFDERLLGSWEQPSSSDRATIGLAEDGTYSIDYTSQGVTRKFAARLGRLDNTIVLDVWPVSMDEEQTSHAVMMLPSHVIIAVEIGEDEIATSQISPEALLAALDRNELSVVHTRNEDMPLLRGSSEELRAALGGYLLRPDALTETGVWRRSESQPR
jgi:hypothetical protein